MDFETFEKIYRSRAIIHKMLAFVVTLLNNLRIKLKKNLIFFSKIIKKK